METISISNLEALGFEQAPEGWYVKQLENPIGAVNTIEIHALIEGNSLFIYFSKVNSTNITRSVEIDLNFEQFRTFIKAASMSMRYLYFTAEGKWLDPRIFCSRINQVYDRLKNNQPVFNDDGDDFHPDLESQTHTDRGRFLWNS